MKVTRKAYKRIKWLVLVVAIALVSTAVPLGVFLSAPTVEAVNVTTWDQMKSQIEGMSSGSSLEVTIPTGTTLSAGFGVAINVRANTNVTVINNGQISVSKFDRDWHHINGNMFNVASGATLTLSGSGTYESYHKYDTQDVSRDRHIVGSSRMSIVRNNGGTVNITSGTYNSYNHHEWHEVSGVIRYGNGSIFFWNTAVWNQSDSSVTNITGGNINITSYAACSSSSDDNFGQINNSVNGGMRLFTYSYGVYGGQVNMNGGSINIETSSWYKGPGSETRRAAVAGTTAYGIMSENIHMTNGSINVLSNHGGWQKSNVVGAWTPDGLLSSWAAGLAYKNNRPVVDGGTITTSLTNTEAIDAWNNTNKFSKKNFAVLQTPSASCVSYDPANYDSLSFYQTDSNRNGYYPLSSIGLEHRWKASGLPNRDNEYLNVRGSFSGEPVAGTAVDSNGRTTTYNNANMAKGQNGSASAAKNMYIFRYYRADGSLWKWQYSADTSIAATGRIHYLTDPVVTPTTSASNVEYDYGYQPVDSYHWELRSISATQRSYSDTQYVDLEALVNTPASQMTITDTFTYPGATHTFTHQDVTTFQPRTAGNYVYAFIDYYEMPEEEVRLSYTPNTVLTYDGEAVTAQDLGIQIWGCRHTTDTRDDDDITAYVTPTYSYTGTSPSGESLSGTGLPKDAGEYTIHYEIPANTDTNRLACSGDLTMQIVPVNPEFADTSATITYPETLGSIDITGILNLPNRDFIDDFDYTWNAGADTVPPVTTGQNYTVTATPKADVRDNYTAASYSFVVNVIVNPHAVNVQFNPASVEYGEELNIASFVTMTDANGNLTDEQKTAVIDTIRKDICLTANGTSSAYVPGTTRTGSYTWGLASTDALNKGNYIVTMTQSGTLTVTKAPLTVTVTTPETTFPYQATWDEFGVYTVTGETVSVLSSHVSGVKEAYDAYGRDISVDDVWVNYPNGGNVGTGNLTADITAMTLSGSKSDCYDIVAVDGVEVTIEKAEFPISAVHIPSLDEQTYDPMTTLADLVATNSSYFVDYLSGGSYAPKDGSQIPTVNQTSYTFIYTPQDQNNYKQTEVEIPITVNKRTVTVSAAPYSLEYGSMVPDSSAYTWTFSGWTDDSAAVAGTDYPVLVSNNGYLAEEGGTLGMGGATWTNSATLTSGYTVTTNAGTPVYINVNGTFDLTADNYAFVFESGEMTVTKRQLEITAPDATAAYGEIPAADPDGVIYGSDEHGFVNDDTVETVFGASNPVSFVYGTGIYGQNWVEYVPGTHAAGEYSIYPVFVNENLTNYEIIKVPGTLTVEKRVVTLVPQDMTLTYGDPVPTEAVFVSADSSVNLDDVYHGTIAIETNYTQGSNAGGSYYIRAVCNDDGTFTDDQQPNLSLDPNYTIVFGDSAVLTVEKADLNLASIQAAVPQLTFTYSDTITLNEQLQNQGLDSVTITLPNGMEVTGMFSYELGAQSPHVADTGDFEINFTPTASSAMNYNGITAGLVGLVNINKAPVTGSLQIGGQLMANGTVYPATGGLVPSGMDNYTFQWYLIDGGVETDAGTGRRLNLTEADIGKNVRLVATIDPDINGDYEGSAEFVSTVPVSEDLPTIDVTWVKTTFTSPVTYDGQPHEITATVNVPDGDPVYTGDITVKYNGEDTPPVDAGTYYITVDCAGDENYAATTALAVGTLIIQPAELTLDFAVADKTYDATTNATLIDGSVVIASGLIDSDANGVGLNTLNARAVFEDANAGEDKAVDLMNVYLTGDRAFNYTLALSTSTATIEKATVTATARLAVYAVDYSEALADENASGVTVYFSNISGVMSRDRASFAIAEDSVAILNPQGGTTCQVDMSTIQAVPNNNNYVVKVTNTDALTILVNQITPDTAASLSADVLTMPSRVYDSRGNLTDEELRAFIATLEGGKYADQAQFYSWARTDGATPVPQVSTSSTPRSYTVVFNNGDSNYREVTFRVRVPVTKREVVLQAANFTIPYGSESPLSGDAVTYTVLSGLYEDETLLSVFRAEPTVRTNYLRYDNVGTYTVTLNVSNLRNNNYTVVASNGSITVTKVMLTAQATAVSKPYDGQTDVQVTFSELQGLVRPNDDVYLPAFVYGTVADANAGSNKPVTIADPVLQGSAAGNYDLTITNRNRITVTISKLTPTDYSFPSKATIQFGQSLAEAVLDGTERGNGSFYYVLSSEVPTAVGVYAQTYDMVYVPADSNYESVTQKVTLEVTVAQLTLNPVITGSVTVGSTLTANVPGIPANALNYIHYTWYRVGSDGSQTEIGSDTATYTTTNADVGYSIKVVVTFGADDPYQGEGEAVSQTIEEEKLSFWERIWRWWYKLLAAIQNLFRL